MDGYLTNTRKIKYTSAHLAPALCIRFRKMCKAAGEDIAGKNMCIIEYQPSWALGLRYALATSDPYGDHSEKNAFDALWDAAHEFFDAPVTVLSVYTERAPCQQGPAMKNCDQWLWDVFQGKELPRNFTARLLRFEYGRQTPVFYSFDYPSSGAAELNHTLALQKELGITDDPDTKKSRDFYRDEGKSDRDKVTKILKRNASYYG